MKIAPDSTATGQPPKLLDQLRRCLGDSPRLPVLFVQRTTRVGFAPSSGLVRLAVPLQARAENGTALDRGPAQTVEAAAPAQLAAKLTKRVSSRR